MSVWAIDVVTYVTYVTQVSGWAIDVVEKLGEARMPPSLNPAGERVLSPERHVAAYPVT